MTDTKHLDIGAIDQQGHLALDLAIVNKVARLARLAPDMAEQEMLSHQLGQILEHFQNLESLDTEGVEPAYHPQELLDTLRPDQVMASYDREIFMDLTPKHKDGCLMVPRTFD
ncbi:MAG: Asp-tRNA(Asn)/Glu-tRNA(Gln) amidotransferase subunit GatC [Eubacteriales bacterium]|nr:Asp-tRNA(Asn)/Glu-tRNA(Gln) amidotransferase subunit GatC [Eubacteriales bacterium]